jgi:general stress protein CsbA
LFPIALTDWWFFSILALLGMLVIMLGCRLAVHCMASAKKGFGVLPQVRIGLWNRVATGTYVAVALSSAALFFASRFPGAESAFWYPAVLNVFTFASAGVLNLGEEGE